MINLQLLEQLKKEYQANESERRQIISAANNILFEAKKTIFSLQRRDFQAAEAKLQANEKGLQELAGRFGQDRLNREGAYKAAVEEYLESKTFFAAINNEEIKLVSGLDLNYEGYLGGICDLIGELVRYATNMAADGKFDAVAELKTTAEDIMAQLIDFDMTGYLRTKYDQARGHLRKLEQIAYEIRLRGKE